MLLIQLQQAVELHFFQQLVYYIGADSVDSTDSAISITRILSFCCALEFSCGFATGWGLGVAKPIPSLKLLKK